MGVRQEVVFIPVYFSVSFKVGRLTKGHHAHFTTEAHIGLNTCSATKAHSRLKTCTATEAHSGLNTCAQLRKLTGV